jgi:cytochrome b
VKARLWDLPTRLFHWTLVLLVGLSWWSAEEEKLQLHLWLGYTVVFLIVFRILWGFLGSSTARFSSFAVGPRSVVQYLRAGFRWPIAGHAPLGALSVVALLVLLVVLVGSGLIASDEDGLFAGSLSHLVSISTSEAATELHEEVFDILLVFIGLHVAAILFYRLVLGRRLVGPMITGRADLPRGMEPMRPATPIVAIFCVIVALAATAWIYLGAPPLGT